MATEICAVPFVGELSEPWLEWSLIERRVELMRGHQSASPSIAVNHTVGSSIDRRFCHRYRAVWAVYRYGRLMAPMLSPAWSVSCDECRSAVPWCLSSKCSRRRLGFHRAPPPSWRAPLAARTRRVSCFFSTRSRWPWAVQSSSSSSSSENLCCTYYDMNIGALQ